ncbi:MAG: acyltransferase [Agriterribacter sp.]
MISSLMEPKAGKRLSGLDHLRALAIVLVLFYHYRMFQHPEWVDKSLNFGWSGVDLFFVLSGFLISSPLFVQIKNGSNISLSEFVIKRFFRIIPAYLAVLTIYFCIPAFREREALPPLWKFLTFTQNLNFDIQHLGTFSHAWSLCVEEHFYLFFPLVIMALLYFKAAKKGAILLGSLVLLGFMLRLFIWNVYIAPEIDSESFWVTWYRHMYYPTYTRLDGLLAGVSIAALFVFYPSIKQRCAQKGNLLLIAGLVVLTVAYFFCDDQHSFHASIFGFPIVAAGYGLLVMSSVSNSSILYRYKSRVPALIAKLSFALYLSHKGVIHICQPLFAKLGIALKGNLMMLLCMLASVLGAFVLNKIVEEPFLKMRENILRRRKSAHNIVAVAERA